MLEDPAGANDAVCKQAKQDTTTSRRSRGKWVIIMCGSLHHVDLIRSLVGGGGGISTVAPNTNAPCMFGAKRSFAHSVILLRSPLEAHRVCQGISVFTPSHLPPVRANQQLTRATFTARHGKINACLRVVCRPVGNGGGFSEFAQNSTQFTSSKSIVIHLAAELPEAHAPPAAAPSNAATGGGCFCG